MIFYMEQHKISYYVFSVKELEDWLINNVSNGLSEYAISPSRAYALINNPCAKKDDPVVTVAYDNNKSIGFTAVFADDYILGNTQGRIFWGTTEWLEPAYRGKGIAGEMMHLMKEAVGVENYMGLDSSVASVKLDQKQGASIVYYDKVHWTRKALSSWMDKILRKYFHVTREHFIAELKAFRYKNQYVNFIDKETYHFIETHSHEDLFLRQREMLNWMLHYPFFLSTHNDPYAVRNIGEFGGMREAYFLEAIKVYVENTLAGFYIISQVDKIRTLRYLYCDAAHRDEVLASVTLNLFKHGTWQVQFTNPELSEFIMRHNIRNWESQKEKIAFTLPLGMSVDPNLHIQGGDGDMFC